MCVGSGQSKSRAGMERDGSGVGRSEGVCGGRVGWVGMQTRLSLIAQVVIT